MHIETIDIENKDDISRFYSCGKRVRDLHDAAIAKLWRGSENLHRIAGNENIASTFIIAEDDGDIGRLGAYYEKGQDIGFLGWYECIDDSTVSKQLIEAGVEWLKNNGCKKVVGPIDGSTWYNYRFNLTHDRPMIISEPFQPNCYVPQWESSGFVQAETYNTTYSTFPDISLISAEKVAENLEFFGMKLERVTVDLLNKIEQELYDFLIKTFPGNPYFSHVEKEEYDEFSAGIPAVLEDRYSYMALDNQGNPVGLVTCLKDLYTEQYAEEGSKGFGEKKLVIKTIATHPDWQNKQIGTMLMSACYSTAIADGIENVVHALMFEDNVSAKGGEKKFKTIPFVKYALFEREL